ncbi:MAG: PTS sugar transporter subunit IIC [Coprobacillus cateniformis]|nr:PTS sugar transporter subunit IIC [Coprobacillus cateniformis]
MEKFMSLLENKLLPIGAKLAENRYLKAINKGFMIILPLTIFGSIFTLIASFPITAWTEWLAESGLAFWLSLPSKLTVDLIALYTVVAIGYAFTKQEGYDGFSGGLTALMSFLIVTPLAQIMTKDDKVVTAISLDWLGARGLFVAMIVGIVASLLFILFTKKGWVIKMPEGVPPMVSQSFSSLIPMVVIGTIFLIIGYLFSLTSFGSIHSLIYTFIAAPLQKVGGSFGGMVVFTIALHLLWFFGIHGGNVVGSITNPFLLPLALENLAVYQAGGTPEHIYSAAFKNTYQFGGSGMTIALVIMMVFLAKSERFKTLGKLALPANIFYINEPVIFGLPIVLNTTLIIPFVLAPLITQMLAYGLTVIGILPVLIGYQIPWSMPPIISGFIQGGWQVALFQVFSIVLTFAIYYPFFKIVDKQACLEESAVIKE